MQDFVCMFYGWVGNSFVLEVDCVGELFFLGGFDVACMCAVVIWGRVEVPPAHRMIFSCSTLV